jgi:AcrR family transcriptional regulator
LAYDNTTRSAKAQQTRRTVLQAASASFHEHGYGRTTVRGVAEHAGVSPETIYKTFRNKAALLKAVYDVTLAGDDEPLPMAARPEVLAVRDAATPAAAAAAYARLSRLLSGHVAPLLRIVFGARGTDPELDAFVAGIDGERLVGATMTARAWSERGWLAPGTTAERARDIVWTLNSPAVYHLMQDRGWDDAEYERWLADALTATVLTGLRRS